MFSEGILADELARAWYWKFNLYAKDLYPEVSYTMKYCRKLAKMALEVRRLARTRGIILMAHYYQRPEIQETVHFVGDSLGFGLKAKEFADSPSSINFPMDVPASTIWVSAVLFMGETVKVILGDRMRVFMPKFSGCSLVSSLRGLPFDYRKDNVEEVSRTLRAGKFGTHPIDEWKARYPDGLALTYVNSDPETKAKSYAVFTSRNAMRVLEYVMRENPGKRIFMLPDQYLTELVLRMAKVNQNPWIKPELVDVFPGMCHVHKQKIDPLALDAALADHPAADLLIHPECGCAIECMIRASTGGVGARRTFICSTQEMIWRAQEAGSADEFVVATETGHVFTLRNAVPTKRFYPVTPLAMCEFMKATTLESLYEGIRSEDISGYEVIVPEDLRLAGMAAIERMVKIP